MKRISVHGAFSAFNAFTPLSAFSAFSAFSAVSGVSAFSAFSAFLGRPRAISPVAPPKCSPDSAIITQNVIRHNCNMHGFKSKCNTTQIKIPDMTEFEIKYRFKMQYNTNCHITELSVRRTPTQLARANREVDNRAINWNRANL